MATDVMILRAFRDEYLLTNACGRSLVRFYYRHNPPFASAIERSEAAKFAVRLGLKPVVLTAAALLGTGRGEKAGILLVCFVGLAYVGRLRSRYRKGVGLRRNRTPKWSGMP